ncbi:TPA: superinfection immunity protein [Klebsiella variicola subsp. variicola]
MISVWNISFLIFAIITYIISGVIASSREHKNVTAILAINIVLGWSFWVG